MKTYIKRYKNEKVVVRPGFGEKVVVDKNEHKRILITGAGSYIGESFRTYVDKNYTTNFDIRTIDMVDGSWRDHDFSQYDAVFHVAGIAHADVGNVSEELKQKYYAVNTDLAIETAEKAKEAGVKQFLFMSSMIVYGESAGYGKKRCVTKYTEPEPANFYGDSKWQADKNIRALEDDSFHVVVLRPPMIYGKGSKGNYPILAKLAGKLPIFPDVKNERSMLHIDNLCELLCQVMLVGKGGIFFPQNGEYTKTSGMIKVIAQVSGKKSFGTRLLNPVVWIGSRVPGKISNIVQKAFGNMTYDQELSVYPGINYRVVDLRESIERTEGLQTKKSDEKPKALILASVASMIDQFNRSNIQLLLDLRYDVDVICNCKEGNTISEERIQKLISELAEKNVVVHHAPIPRRISDINGIVQSMKFVKQMCDKNQYFLVHCHSPIGSVIARISAIDSRRKGTKVIYTAHGFHFYEGAPLFNWIIFYPIEKVCSKFTDVLITINKEDYEFAKKHMRARCVEYIPGIGVNTKKFRLEKFDISKKRCELGISDNDIIVFSVGELNQNKNQEVIIRAIAKIDKDNVHYFVAGKGDKEQYLLELAEKLNVNLHLLGYRGDIIELLNIADIYVFPSIREGLSVALMEAMASGLPCIVSKIRGNVDLVDQEGGILCDPMNINEFKNAIKLFVEDDKLREAFGLHNYDVIQQFDENVVKKKMLKIYFNR
ncbi:MAG: glycosyltransferase [Lachnospiraceae bacterium]|nr:glycosyltransferase [Lachnospiraceae bacterium]